MIENTADAMKILKDAAARCGGEDYLRAAEADAALDYLTSLPGRRDLIARFRRKLNISHPLARQSCVRAAYEALERHFMVQPPPPEDPVHIDRDFLEM